MSYAIDFGTSNTVITRTNPATDAIETVSLKGISQQLGTNPPLIPSLAYVQNAAQNQVIIGQTVRDRGLDLATDNRFFYGFKRGIGAKIQGFLPELDGKNITFEQVGEWFLGEIINQLQSQTPSNSLDSLIITVPVDSFESYRYWLNQVCQSWSVGQLRLLDEPTAAALGYQATEGNLILVIDFGGGTLDLSLVELTEASKKNPGFLLKFGEKVLGNSSQQKPKTARVLAKAGQSLGGGDIDNWIVDYFHRTQGLPKSVITTRLAERLKIALSSQTKATEVYFDDQAFDTYELTLDRPSFEEILREQEFFSQLDDLINQVLTQAKRNGVEAKDIDSVLLVGGSAQIPAFHTWTQQYFEVQKIKSDRPFEAIARGALQLVKGIEIKDFLYHSYGVRYWNRRTNTHSWHPIIPQGQPIPMTKPIELTLGASMDNQPSIELIIGELGAENLGTEVYFDGSRLVTRSLSKGETSILPLNDQEGGRTIATLDPLGKPGSDRIKVQFQVDTQRCLRITVEDLLTEETLLNNQIVAQLK